jgi:type II secretory pathway component PulF
MKLFEATIRTPDGREFKDRVGAENAQQARLLLQQRHGPRAVPYIPHLIPS